MSKSKTTQPAVSEPEWAIVKDNSSLVGEWPPRVVQIESVNDLTSQSFTWPDGSVENVITTVLARGYHTEREAYKALASIWTKDDTELWKARVDELAAAVKAEREAAA